ncbi:MAG: DUF423 domain-containing protein [Pirellulaceae bacterium]
MNAKTWLVLGACLGGLAVGLGAFGAHGLPKYYDLLELSAADDLRHKGLANWEIAARYHMYHALAMLGVGILADRQRLVLLDSAGICFFFGILVFSGCLYALALTGTKILGAIVPVGGVSFIVGWVLLALAGKQFAEGDAKPLPALAERLAAAAQREESAGAAMPEDESNSA